VTRGQCDTRLTVGAVDGTAGYPRTAKFLQFGGRFDSEGVTLARIHIPQLSKRLCGVRVWCLRGPLGKCGSLDRSLVGRRSGLFGACRRLGAAATSGGHWGGRCVVWEELGWCENCECGRWRKVEG
jgi:hypothetical protein